MTTRGELDGLGRRLVGFLVLPVLSLLASLLALPLVARHSTTDEWAAIAVGQSLGLVASIVVSYGWSLQGPALAAVAEGRELSRLYFTCLAIRLRVWVIVAPVAALGGALLAPGSESTLAAAMAVAMTTTGLSIAWYAIGRGRPFDIAAFELVPRVVSGVLAAVTVGLGVDVLVYPALLASACLVGYGGHVLCVLQRHGRPRLRGLPSTASLLREGWSSMLTELGSSLYSSAASALVSTQAPAAEIARFSSGERVYKLGAFSVVALSNAGAGWVAMGDRLARMRRLLMGQVATGLVGLVTLAVAGPWLSGLLFGQSLAMGRVTALMFGISFLMLASGSALGRCMLVPLGHTGRVLWSTLVGAAIGVPVILVLAHLYGASGGAAGLALSQSVVTLSMAHHVRLVLRDDQLTGKAVRVLRH